uniref:Phytase-like domain-containing protein n=1 Tax=Corethron hystrix TaxID=216773 RepID=A0A7S1BQY7_9STRA|eukprot:CAMPEP_0113312062 /NCGR_PEP_ID=MMETSP0010_2-20120614/9038_1 /TAXON_ID=216773 ORGANISM="Corethron hystrix, Strain 308" /NCGR_SAMPLE_ID=MMETSP0010_2 /ASSEMBLY_ACC=CAM_ASM_000155 /LENGTH=533 /DNA_ID=CAMNT_0000167803 /DNA_START=24 /DNA_END=1625 /DNA_ORIENTATION=- /assembly_acc=CAM_ASM_000155
MFSTFAVITLLSASPAIAQNADYQDHYLVGILNYPNSFVPEEFQNHTSGTYLPNDVSKDWTSYVGAPFDYVPGVGFSDIEPYYDADGNKVVGEFYCLSDNGFGGVFDENSGDYPLNIQHMHVQKPFTYRHGESTFEKYTEAEHKGLAILHDPNGYIKWENGADIQVTYKIPDDTWNDWKERRVITGRDIDPEGLAVINQECAVLGDEHMPAVMMVNPKTGEILSEFVRTPDIDENGKFNGKFLSTSRDKVHCSIEALENDTCRTVKPDVVDAEYRRVDKSGGYESFGRLDDGNIVAFIEKQDGDSTLQDEPGVRVYKVLPGDCTSGSAPKFDSFMGFYPFEINGVKAADLSRIPGSSRFILVLERNGFPKGHMFPSPAMPANNVCIVDLLDVDENMVMRNKKCIINFHNIDDPWDVDGNGILKYAQTQVTNEAVIVVDDYCIVAATDTNFPWVNQFKLNETNTAYLQEVSDARFMVICFVEPIFNLKHPIYESFDESASKPSTTSASSMDLGLTFFNCIIPGLSAIIGLLMFA